MLQEFLHLRRTKQHTTWAHLSRRVIGEGLPERDDGGYHASRSPRTEPAMALLHPTADPCQWFSRLASALDS